MLLVHNIHSLIFWAILQSNTHTDRNTQICLHICEVNGQSIRRYMPDFLDYTTGGAMSVPEDIFIGLPLYSTVTYTGKRPSCVPVTSNFLHMARSYGGFYTAQQPPSSSCTAEVLHTFSSTSLHQFTQSKRFGCHVTEYFLCTSYIFSSTSLHHYITSLAELLCTISLHL